VKKYSQCDSRENYIRQFSNLRISFYEIYNIGLDHALSYKNHIIFCKNNSFKIFGEKNKFMEYLKIDHKKHTLYGPEKRGSRPIAFNFPDQLTIRNFR